MPRIGAEIELIPVHAGSGRVVPLGGNSDTRSTVSMLRAFGGTHGWQEHGSQSATPLFRTPGGGAITFEPGGQIEYSSPPHMSLDALLADVRATVASLGQAVGDYGIELLTVGIDPSNPLESVPLQLHTERYRRMSQYFARIGPSGARMMRQTASLQINVDTGPEPLLRWRLLNALAPYILAIFANSSRYAGRPTGHRSFRGAVWRALDPDRTGLLSLDADPIAEYLQFGLNAPAMLLGVEDGAIGRAYRPFGEWLEHQDVDEHSWATHLTTLFPEVRPRGHFEIRSCDVVPMEHTSVPLIFVAGLVYHAPAARAAMDLIGAPDPDRLVSAGHRALDDPAIARTAVQLADLALAGARALGPNFIRPHEIERASNFFATYTSARRTLATKPGPTRAHHRALMERHG